MLAESEKERREKRASLMLDLICDCSESASLQTNDIPANMFFESVTKHHHQDSRSENEQLCRRCAWFDAHADGAMLMLVENISPQ
jgi:hypothetical protein